MKKKTFIIAGIMTIIFFLIMGFGTKTMKKNSIEETKKEMEVIAEDVKDITKIEFEKKQQETTEETTTETESVISKKENEKSEVVSQQKQEQKSKSENKTSAKEKEKSNNTQQKESNTLTPAEKDVEKEQENIEEKPQEVKEEIVVEEKQVDEEYERLLKEVEYVTYDECMKAGFEIAFSDTVNILGFDPVEVIYKGQVLGYKLKIHYTNPMGN